MKTDKIIWLKRSPEWIKNNPGQPTMYKGVLNLDDDYKGNVLLKKEKKKKLDEIKNTNSDFPDAGVYIIVNNETKSVYVGQSINMSNRLRSHKHYILEKAVNKNQVYDKMIEDKIKHGIESFEFIKYILMPNKNGMELVEVENDVMHEFMAKGYSLYNRSVYLGNIYCPIKYKDDIVKVIDLLIINPERLSELKSFINSYK